MTASVQWDSSLPAPIPHMDWHLFWTEAGRYWSHTRSKVGSCWAKSDFHSKKPEDKESIWQVLEAAIPTADLICTGILKKERLCCITAEKVLQLLLILTYRDHLACNWQCPSGS